MFSRSVYNTSLFIIFLIFTTRLIILRKSYSKKKFNYIILMQRICGTNFFYRSNTFSSRIIMSVNNYGGLWASHGVL